MRLVVLLAGLFGSACMLDTSQKPECLEDRDCHGSLRQCVAEVCVANHKPVGMPDVLYYAGSLTGTATVVLAGDVGLNDSDADGDLLRLSGTPGASGFRGLVSAPEGTTIEVKIAAADLPSAIAYRVWDGFETSESISVRLERIVDSVTIPVEAGTTAPLSNVLSALTATGATVELIAAPSAGALAGQLPAVNYVPAPGYCGADAATYRVHAANGPFDVTLHFAVGLVLVDEQRTIEFGDPTTIDVLANERAGLALVSTTAAFATVAPGAGALTVAPPTNQVATYRIGYTARDSRGCEGTATLTLAVEFPTRVIVGENLTGDAFDAALSASGRYLAFTSADATLVTGDTNAAADVFVLDLTTTAIERVSFPTGGGQANEASGSPTISADGRYVAFVSRATNLDTADTTSVEDVYLHDRNTGATALVSRSVDGTGSNRPSITPHISSSGSHIVFASTATRLVTNDSNDAMDVFVRDVGGSMTRRVSVTGSGAQVPFASYARPRISGNGRYVALSSSSSLDGSNSGGAFLVDTLGSAVSRIDSSVGEVDLDETARFVIHADFSVTLTDRVVDNVTTLGTGTFPSISASGRYAAYTNGKRVLGHGAGVDVDVIVNRAGMPVAAAPLRRPEMSGDGRWIVFATSEWPGYQGRFVIVRVWNRAYVP